MTQEELMIGDLLQAQPNNKIVRVVEIKEDEIVCSERCYDLKPISITPEILEKNGFDNYGPDIYYLIDPNAEDSLSISLRIEKGRWRTRIKNGYNFQRMHVEYVHELQHALRLCKIEKEIKL